MTDTGYRVLVVDDHPIFVRGVRNELEDAGDIQAIGECANGTEAVALVEQKRPDVVLIDLRIPPAAGDEAEFCWPDVIRRIVEQALDTKILVLSCLRNRSRYGRCSTPRAHGYPPKQEKHVLQAVRTVAEGKMVLDVRVRSALNEQQDHLAGGDLLFGLTRRSTACWC